MTGQNPASAPLLAAALKSYLLEQQA